MGYLTSYSLSIIPGTHPSREILSAFIDAFKATDTGMDLHLDTNPCGAGVLMSNLRPAKWYDEKAQMRKFSAQFPTATFLVHGEGEERGDVWEHRYRNGLLEERVQEGHWGDWHVATA